MSLLGNLFKAVWNIFCGSPAEEQKPPSAPQQQQQHWQHQQQQQQQHWQQQVPVSYPPSHGHQKPPVQQHHVPVPVQENKPWRPQKYQNDNEINSNNPHYKSLRARANEEGDLMAKCFSQGSDAYNRGDHAGAKQFSTKGKQHQKRMDELNKEASDWIYKGFSSICVLGVCPYWILEPGSLTEFDDNN
ncbi:hypothetical protein EST38_g250 [Candolleomyces aberdarensis]|uniref:DUF1771 domain-containing protein n=1 Tax=Candolleomyces aberdarensis TaxID=2316362 RepID=A0A4Q2E105_9AGAR|nr:hypothetical protein EST38_g250 [Candolleomyces aberdarensis]